MVVPYNVKWLEERGKDKTLSIVNSGTLYLTQKRFLLEGTSGNKQIQYDKILRVSLKNNKIFISKDTGKSPYLQIESPKLFEKLLNRLLQEY